MKARAVRFPAFALVLLLAAGVVAGGPASAPSPRRVPVERAIDRPAMARQVRAEMLHAWHGYEAVRLGARRAEAAQQDGARLVRRVAPDDAGRRARHAAPPGPHRRRRRRRRTLIVEKLDFDKDVSVKNFEITIRLLGGLLSSYQMTGDERLLALADDLGTRLLPAFDSPTGMPYMYVNLRTGKTSGTTSNPAEIGTLLLEFGTLSKLTDKPVYYDKAKKRARRSSTPGARRSASSARRSTSRPGEWKSRASHVGGGIDSYYEYLLKCARLFGDEDCARMWKESVRALNAHLADDAPPGLWYGQVDMETGRRTATEFGALHAFLPAVLALGGRSRAGPAPPGLVLQDVDAQGHRARGPRLPHDEDPRTPATRSGPRSSSRRTPSPLTHDPRYLEMGRTFLEDLVKHCRTDAATRS